MKVFTVAATMMAYASSMVSALYMPAGNVGEERESHNPLTSRTGADSSIVFKRSCTQEVSCYLPPRKYKPPVLRRFTC